MKHFLFEEFNSGERFIVGADYLGEALVIADGLATEFEFYLEEAETPTILYLGELTEEEAEASGLDEY